jgi:hypothetical protein
VACEAAKNENDDGSWTVADAKATWDLVEKEGVVSREMAWAGAIHRRDHEETAVKLADRALVEGHDDGVVADVAAVGEKRWNK